VLLIEPELLRRIRPQARVYVINVDDFFDRVETQSLFGMSFIRLVPRDAVEPLLLSVS
jgi:CRP-like cAMP-binding protein